MKDEQIIRYFNNSATEGEKAEILAWISESVENEKYFGQLYDLWILPQMTKAKSDKEEMQKVLKKIKGETSKQTRKGLNPKRGANLFFYSAAAVVAVLLVIDIATRFNRNDSVQKNITSEITSNNVEEGYIQTIYTPKGAKAYLVLPDSSKVKLNSDTKISFPNKFTGNIREVYIDGEAYFEVTKDEKHPMVVKTPKGYDIKVLGTKFNVCSYSGDKISKTTLIEGRINIIERNATDTGNDENVISVLSKGDSFVKNDEERNEETYTNAVASDDIAWTNDVLIFQKTPMRDVLTRLERWHGTKFVVDDPDIYNIKLTAEYANESIVQILEVIKFSSGINYSISNNIVVLSVKPL